MARFGKMVLGSVMVKHEPSYRSCRLCGDAGELCLSHIYPKFYWEWRKRTGSGYLRDSSRPNLRFQDGYKIPMLCLACENRFSGAETAFSSELFRPLVTGTAAAAHYSTRSYYCLVSIAWRCLALGLDAGEFTELPDDHVVELREAENAWRRFLLGSYQLQQFSRFHLFVTDFPNPESPQINMYLTRLTDVTPIWNQQGLYGFLIKFGKFLVVAEMSGFDPSTLQNTMIESGGGSYDPRRTRLSGYLGPFLLDRATRTRQLRSDAIAALSERQRGVIRRNVERLGDKFFESELFRAQVLDSSWDRSIPKVGVNERCPCGSGKKYKHCHRRISRR